MTTIAALLQEPLIILLIISIIVLTGFNQYLWHRRQVYVIENIDFLRSDVSLPSQTYQVMGAGFVIFALGLGGLLEVYILTEASGSVILLSTGLALLLFAGFLHSTTGEKSDNDS